MNRDVTIIGAGPAGVTAAIQLARSGMCPVIVEKNRVGGLVRNACRVENYPGFPDGIPGLQLASLLAEHLERAGLSVLPEEVVRLDHDGRVFTVGTPARQWQTPIVVLASGTKPKPFAGADIPPDVLPYVHSDIDTIRGCTGRCIAVVGGGDAAFDYALSMAAHNDVVMLCRSEQPRCLPLLRERAGRSPRIAIRFTAVVEAFAAAGADGLELACRWRDKPFRLQAHHVVLAIGREPQRDFLSQAVRLQADAFEASGILYEIGDIRSGEHRQVAIAVGDGMQAAMAIADRWRKGHP